MRFLKSIGSGLKKTAMTIGKGLTMAERVVSAADKASGGLLRATAATATGGLSEQALGAYKAQKGVIKRGLETTQRVGRIAERASERGLVGSGAWTMAKEHAGARGRDYMQQAEGLARQNPKIYAGLTKPMRPQFI